MNSKNTVTPEVELFLNEKLNELSIENVRDHNKIKDYVNREIAKTKSISVGILMVFAAILSILGYLKYLDWAADRAAVKIDEIIEAEFRNEITLQLDLSERSLEKANLLYEETVASLKENKPIFFKKYSAPKVKGGNSPTIINTGIDSRLYTIGVVGFDAGTGDIQEHDSGKLMYVYPYIEKSKNKWFVKAKFRTHKNASEFDIWLIVISKAISLNEYNHK